MVYYAAGHRDRANGDLGSARAETEHGLNIARRGGLRLDIVYGLSALAQIAEEASTPADAADLRARAIRQLGVCPDPGFLGSLIGSDDDLDRAPAAALLDGTDDLSERELAVLRMLATRLSLREVGDELYVSLNTVKTHTRNIYAKLRVGSRQEAVVRGRQLDLLRGPRHLPAGR
jgi:LuxR family transcriptional regulator, maltose regulon positive regulatory protein